MYKKNALFYPAKRTIFRVNIFTLALTSFTTREFWGNKPPGNPAVIVTTSTKTESKKMSIKVEGIEKDALVMALRLMGENEDSLSPEVKEVMQRWRPICISAIKQSAIKDKAKQADPALLASLTALKIRHAALSKAHRYSPKAAKKGSGVRSKKPDHKLIFQFSGDHYRIAQTIANNHYYVEVFRSGEQIEAIKSISNIIRQLKEF